MKTKIIIFLIMLFFQQYAQAQVDTIKIDAKRLLINRLKIGTSQYMVSIHGQNLDKVKSLWLWSRKVSLQEWQGKEAIVITQQWHTQDTTLNQTIFSVAEKETFKPIYHYTKMQKRGIEAFNFEKDKIEGRIPLLTTNAKVGA